MIVRFSDTVQKNFPGPQIRQMLYGLEIWSLTLYNRYDNAIAGLRKASFERCKNHHIGEKRFYRKKTKTLRR